MLAGTSSCPLHCLGTGGSRRHHRTVLPCLLKLADPSSHKNYKRVPVLVNLLVAVAKHQMGSYLRKEGFHLADSLRVQSILVGRAWQQEQKVAGHMAFTVGKQKEMEASAELASSFVFGLRLLQCNGVTHNYSGSSHLK